MQTLFAHGYPPSEKELREKQQTAPKYKHSDTLAVLSPYWQKCLVTPPAPPGVVAMTYKLGAQSQSIIFYEKLYEGVLPTDLEQEL